MPPGVCFFYICLYNSAEPWAGTVSRSTVTVGVVYNSVADVLMTIPLVKSHPSDSEPHASPGLSECERRNPKPETLNLNRKPLYTLKPGSLCHPPRLLAIVKSGGLGAELGRQREREREGERNSEFFCFKHQVFLIWACLGVLLGFTRFLLGFDLGLHRFGFGFYLVSEGERRWWWWW